MNISNSEKYSGATSTTLTVSNVTSADALNYTCVVTAGCGSQTSFQGALTLSATTLLNPSFELSNISGVATNWTGYQRSPNPTTVWTIQTAAPPVGTGTNYQQIANTTSTGGGGVRQDIKNCVIGASYTVAGWFRGNSSLYSTCTVKVSPTASTSWATAVNLSPVGLFDKAALEGMAVGVPTLVTNEAFDPLLGADKPLLYVTDADPFDENVWRACNPALAHRALGAVHDVGLLLPCNVIVHNHGDESAVSIVDPAQMAAGDAAKFGAET